ncbi:MAG: hypothetical protein GY906_40420, partial [bacterium]|nr:hypothetical protein [bacterium]
LVVRDEEETIRANIDYHLAQGVDLVMVTAHRSRDRTLEYLKSYEERGLVELTLEEGRTFLQSEWVTRMARAAAQHHHADWIVHADGDEFWWPQVGSLKTALGRIPRKMGFTRAPRFNFLPIQPADGGLFFETMVIREVSSLNAIGRPLPGKVCHRADASVSIPRGCHTLSSPNFKKRWMRPPLCVFHYPMRNYSQFERKVVQGNSAVERPENLPPGTSACWRWLYEQHQMDRLREFYDNQVIDSDWIESGLVDGRLVEDRSVADFMAALDRSGERPMPGPEYRDAAHDQSKLSMIGRILRLLHR